MVIGDDATQPEWMINDHSNEASLMTKGRMIDCKIRSSQTFAKLTYRQRDLWQGLIEVADDQGRLPGHPAYIRSVVWAYDDVSMLDVDAELNVLKDAGNILRYWADESEYIQIVNWHIYQAGAAWLGPSDYPAPNGWQDRCRYHGKNNEIVTVNWEIPTKSLPSPLTSPLPSTLPSTLPKREGDVNGDIKGDNDNDNDNDSDEVSPAFEQIKSHIEQLTGILAIPAFIKPIEEIIAFGGTKEDITAGYSWFKDNANKTFKYYGQLVGPTRTAMSKRLGGNGKSKKKSGSGHTSSEWHEEYLKHPELYGGEE